MNFRQKKGRCPSMESIPSRAMWNSKFPLLRDKMVLKLSILEANMEISPLITLLGGSDPSISLLKPPPFKSSALSPLSFSFARRQNTTASC
ncbi:hypothetical protein EV2_044015 [Malus domestica]